MEYFAGAGCLDGGNAGLRHGTKRRRHPQGEGAVYAGGYRSRTCTASCLPKHRNEKGRMAPMLYHGLRQLGLPVICIESRQAYQALKLLQERASGTKYGFLRGGKEG